MGVDTKLLKSVIHINSTQPGRLVDFLKDTIGSLKGKKIAVLGLTFKPNSDDLRESASLSVIQSLLVNGANVFCHDPLVSSKEKRAELKDLPITLVKKVGDALKNADGALLVTAWDEYKKLTPTFFKELMRNPVLVDGRRMYSKAAFIGGHVMYKGIGLGSP